MNKKEAISQLESFITDCKEFESVESTEKDVKALEIAIAVLKRTAQEVPVQEQLSVTIQVKDKELLKESIENINSLINKLNFELKSLPGMFEFKI